ncbi:hypothetical protein MKW92_019996, partial [Papaver armeniacum]
DKMTQFQQQSIIEGEQRYIMPYGISKMRAGNALFRKERLIQTFDQMDLTE